MLENGLGSRALVLGAAFCVWSCGGSGLKTGATSTGGTTGAGGASATGRTTTAGGALGVGGASATGGTSATAGGTLATGGTSAPGDASAAGGSAATGGAVSTGGVPAAGGATGTPAMTLAEACTRNCALAGGLPTCSTTTTECVQNCMATYDNTSAVGARWGYGLELGQQYTDMMTCMATNFTSSADFVCARQEYSPLNRWAPVLGPSTDSPCEGIICEWTCDDGCLLDCNDSAHGDVDPWLWLSCGCGGP
jgi:hypothetical protein